MIHQIENELFNIAISAVGAEISSFKSKKSGIEYMWQADPSIWGSHAPVLFPIVGGLRDNKFEYQGQYYPLNRHGFVRRNKNLKVVAHSSTNLSLQLRANDETKKLYPFAFIFSIHFSLEKNKLIIKHDVENTDQRDIYFSLGAHPAFNCPIHKQESYNDYYLEFQETESLRTWYLNELGLIEQEGKTILKQSRILPLNKHLFDQDALIFKTLKSRKISLCSQKSPQKIIIRYADFTSLGIWAKPAAPFICIEPWIGYADAANSNYRIQDKEGIIKLKPHRIFTTSYSIEVQE